MYSAETSFEEPLVELRRRIEELEAHEGSSHGRELAQLRRRLRKQTEEVFENLSRWERTLLARHADRPYTLDYIDLTVEDWVELHGDRGYADDPALVTGLATFRGRRLAIVGHQKGRDTKQRIHRNFGQPRPEGYRKALRVMRLAERFELPVLSLVDTPGAYPGIGAEERGQAEAIARNLAAMAALRTPIVVVITGEGGSGGALAIGVGDRVFMLEYSIYSVISPEGCAAILWKDQGKKHEAAEAMKITAPDLKRLDVIDGIIGEPTGGAHTDPEETARRVGNAVESTLDELCEKPIEQLLEERYQKYRRLGVYAES